MHVQREIYNDRSDTLALAYTVWSVNIQHIPKKSKGSRISMHVIEVYKSSLRLERTPYINPSH